MAAHQIEDAFDRSAAIVASENAAFGGAAAAFPKDAPVAATDGAGRPVPPPRAVSSATAAPCDGDADGGRGGAPPPAAVPVSPCASEESPPAAAAVCVTGRFDDVESKYRVDPRVLGAGHQGTVRECVDRTTGLRYAVKSVRKDEVKPAGLVREIALLREMKHPNLVRLVDVFEDVEYVHLVTDLCSGGELFDRIVAKALAWNRGRSAVPCFEEDEAARIVRQLLAAVSHLHRNGAVHRDVKPENVLFASPYEGAPVKLVDLGLSRKHGPDDPPMTTVVGTPYYIAPEVLRRRYGKASDLWSLGIVAYVLLCGYPPFNGRDGRETHRSVLRGRYRFPPEEWDGIGPEARDFVDRLLRSDPAERMTADQALHHPWMVRRGRDGGDDGGAEGTGTVALLPSRRCCPGERVDRSSVEVVYLESSSLARRLPAPLRRGNPASPSRSPPRKVRASMFGP